ncbi:MAG: exodeoxyribonuclease VII large subunit [Clostridiales Family XIII bacterium]|nr:exodeoxyribonuclease VII large subunit [Clostridiales Family XIII bacterium]
MKPIRVSQLNSYIRRVLSSDPVLSAVSVVGEISNFKRHGGGHVYFSLRDADSKVNCFLPSDVYEALPRGIGDGDEATATGRIDVYERGGYYSLYVRELAFQGAGGLAAAFEKQKAKLLAEGLFDPARKKPLPVFPLTVALVTSDTGAAVRDMLKIITSKNDVVDILIYPTLVQGPDAPARIAEGIAFINTNHPETDVVIVGRGGGSAEELWAFNEEIVARAIFASDIPVISAVGHETDVTVADFVADARAETPTAAADMAVPDTESIRAETDALFFSMKDGLSALLEHGRLLTEARRPARLVGMLENRIDLSAAQATATLASFRAAVYAVVSRAKNATTSAYARLVASDPARILSMGYAALTKNGRPILSVTEAAAGDAVAARLADGSLDLTVEGVRGN